MSNNLENQESSPFASTSPGRPGRPRRPTRRTRGPTSCRWSNVAQVLRSARPAGWEYGVPVDYVASLWSTGAMVMNGGAGRPG